MKSSHDSWTVTQSLGRPQVGAQSYDPRLEATFHDEHWPVELVCTKAAAPGLRFVVEATLRTVRYHAQGRTWREPYQLTDATRITVEGVGASSAALFRSIGVGGLHKAINHHFSEAARMNPDYFMRPRALPTPGRAGHPDAVYAQWAQRVIDARERHGRGYMKQLLADHPGHTRSNILRMVERAEALGLYKAEPVQSGHLGKGQLTAKGRRLVEGIKQ